MYLTWQQTLNIFHRPNSYKVSHWHVHSELTEVLDLTPYNKCYHDSQHFMSKRQFHRLIEHCRMSPCRYRTPRNVAVSISLGRTSPEIFRSQVTSRSVCSNPRRLLDSDDAGNAVRRNVGKSYPTTQQHRCENLRSVINFFLSKNTVTFAEKTQKYIHITNIYIYKLTYKH